MTWISGKTRVCGLIDDPIEHALSPGMHNAAFKKLGLDYVYVPFKVKQENLKEAIAGLRALNVRGFNITIPHKMAVIPFLDRIDPIAGKIGAVNTVVNDGGTFSGYYIDDSGFLQSWLEEGIEPKGKRIVILGAGGSAKAIAFILAERGAHLVILNRHSERAQELASRISPDVRAGALTAENLAENLKEAGIIINTTSVGMVPDTDATPVPSQLLSSKLVVVDIVYNPIETRLLKEVKAAGARTIDGVAMLVWQGAQGFEKWTGVKAPVAVMREEVLKGLRREK